MDNHMGQDQEIVKFPEKNEQKYWLSPVGKVDDFGDIIEDEIIDGKTYHGNWGLMTPLSWQMFTGTNGQLGIGLGQRYKKIEDGRWLRVEG